jgi:hypothetical protein
MAFLSLFDKNIGIIGFMSHIIVVTVIFSVQHTFSVLALSCCFICHAIYGVDY